MASRDPNEGEFVVGKARPVLAGLENVGLADLGGQLVRAVKKITGEVVMHDGFCAVKPCRADIRGRRTVRAECRLCSGSWPATLWR